MDRERNSDLVEYINVADVDALGHQSHLSKTYKKCYQDMMMSMQNMHAQRIGKSVYGRCIWF